MTPLRLAIFVVCAVCSASALAQIQPNLVTDLSADRVEIKYSFAGADLLLFGAIAPPEDYQRVDILVIVEGPPTPTIVRRKDRVAGIWVNNAALKFAEAPGYYVLATSRPLDEITTPDILMRLALLPRDRSFGVTGEVEDPVELEQFRRGLLRRLEGAGLYREAISAVEIIDDRLFRTDVNLPANVPVGIYTAKVYVFADGRLIARNQTALSVDKSGFERSVYNFAHQLPFFYGLVAVMIALTAGWVAGTVASRIG